jgi:hypothetical protein
MDLSKRLQGILPTSGLKNFFKFKSLLLGMVAGPDSIDDISKLKQDKLFSRLVDGGLVDSTLGDFLRSFCTRKIELLGQLLITYSIELRRILFPGEKFVIYSRDF